MTTIFEALGNNTAHPNELFVGDILYYADYHSVENNLTHLLQVTKVTRVTSQSVSFDNGRKFSLETGEEMGRGSKGILYPYTNLTIAMVQESQSKLSLLNDVESIDFQSLSVQQLSMIKDVARGAFTQVTAPSPCGGGCGDKVQVSGIDFELDPVKVATSFKVFDTDPTEVSATIGFNDATYELTPSEIDAIEAADEVDDDDIVDDEE